MLSDDPLQEQIPRGVNPLKKLGLTAPCRGIDFDTVCTKDREHFSGEVACESTPPLTDNRMMPAH